MRTGAIFTRGSCRALKWMALFGVVFALGAGSASAQLSGGTMTVTASPTNPNEGTSTTITVSLTAEVDRETTAETTVTVTVAGAATPAANLSPGSTPAEDSDWTFNEATTSLELKFPKNESSNSVRHSRRATVVLQTTTDPDAEHEGLTVTATLAGGGLTDVDPATGDGRDSSPLTVQRDITIRDLQTQTYVLKLGSGQTGANAPKEGRAITVNLNAVPKHVQGSKALTLHIEQPQDYSFGITDGTGTTVTGSTITLGSADGSALALGTARDQANMATIAITPPSIDGNRVADTVTLRAWSGSAGSSVEEDALPITVEDANALPDVKVTVVDANDRAESPQPTTVEEGQTLRLRLDLAKAGTDAAEDLTISLVPTGDADALDYDLEQNQPIVIGIGTAQSSVVSLAVEEDEDVGNEMLSFKAVVSGEARYGTETADSEDVLSLTILDKTTRQVEAKSVADVDKAVMDAMAASVGDEGLNPGESFKVMGTALFMVTDGYTVTYAPSSSSDVVSASVAGDMLTIEANSAGTATVTVTANAEMAMSAATTTSQTVADRAKVSFDVTVTDTKLTVTSLAADPMEIDEGGMSMITATLNRAVTSGDGEVMIGLDVVGAGMLDMESIAIAAGDMSGSAMLTATEDDDYMDAEVTVVASGSGIDGTMQVKIMVNDLDEEPVAEPTVRAKDGAAEMIAAAIAAAAGDSDWTVGGMVATVDMSMLFEVDEGVTAVYSGTSSDDDIVSATTTGGETLALTPMGAGMATITVTGSDQAGGSAATVTHDATVVHANLTVMVTAESMAIMEGGSTMITAKASRMVEASDGMVKVNLTIVGDGTLSADSIEIAAGSDSGSVTLTATEDDDDYMDETVTVIAAGAGIDGNTSIEIAVTDDDEAPVDEPTVRAKDGAAEMIAAAIATAAGGADWMVGGMVATVDMSMLFEVDEGVTAVYSGTSSNEDVVKSMTTGATMLALTPMGAGSATITVTASDQAGGGVATVTHDAMVVLQTLMVDVTASAQMVDEGGSVTLTAQANRTVTADTVLTLTVTGDSDAVEAPGSLTIAMGADMGTAMVMAMEDADTADEMVTVVVTGPGIASPVSLEIGVTDNDRTVVAKSQEQVTAVFVTTVAAASGPNGWLPDGDAAMVDMSELFTIDDGASVEYMAESSAEDMVTASASGSMLTLTPMATGAATITVTATDTSGDADDHAMVMADVEVGVLPLMVELHGPDDMNLVEGNSYEIKAMANRAVTEDTTVEIMRDRAESSAGGDDYSVENITIAAGETMGATMLMVTNDGPGDASTGMPEKLVLYGMVGNMQTNSLSFYVWDAAVPALPVIAQLLLAAFLAIGGYRRYRRR